MAQFPVPISSGPKNPLLSRLGVIARKGRERFWDSNSYVTRSYERAGRQEAALFFRSSGCRYDLAGGCTMCDYSVGSHITPAEIVDSVRNGLAALPDQLDLLLASPSGSFLDEWEVPRPARDQILDLLGGSGHRSFAFETRAETIDEAKIVECRRRLRGKPLLIYVGIESSNPYISLFCVNKELDLLRFEQAVEVANEHGCRVSANVLLGAPFLSEQEAVNDTVETVRWSLSKGASECCIFPTHVKHWTQLALFHERGLYRPPSLWALIEALYRLKTEIVQEKIEIAWYSSNGAFNIIQSPQTCNSCYSATVSRLDLFSKTGDFAIIESLRSTACECRSKWVTEFGQEPTSRLCDRVSLAYDELGNEFVPQWWAKARKSVLESVSESKGEPSGG